MHCASMTLYLDNSRCSCTCSIANDPWSYPELIEELQMRKVKILAAIVTEFVQNQSLRWKILSKGWWFDNLTICKIQRALTKMCALGTVTTLDHSICVAPKKKHSFVSKNCKTFLQQVLVANKCSALLFTRSAPRRIPVK